MSAFYKFLFPMKPDGTAISLLLLALRLLFGGLLLSHGIQKWTNFESMSAAFPDPLGVGHSVSLGLAIFGELFCSIGFILGALYRLAMIPMIFTMGVAFFVIHGHVDILHGVFVMKRAEWTFCMVEYTFSAHGR